MLQSFRVLSLGEIDQTQIAERCCHGGVIFTEGSGSRLTVSVDLVEAGTEPFV